MTIFVFFNFYFKDKVSSKTGKFTSLHFTKYTDPIPVTKTKHKKHLVQVQLLRPVVFVTDIISKNYQNFKLKREDRKPLLNNTYAFRHLSIINHNSKTNLEKQHNNHASNSTTKYVDNEDEYNNFKKNNINIKLESSYLVNNKTRITVSSKLDKFINTSIEVSTSDRKYNNKSSQEQEYTSNYLKKQQNSPLLKSSNDKDKYIELVHNNKNNKNINLPVNSQKSAFNPNQKYTNTSPSKDRSNDKVKTSEVATDDGRYYLPTARSCDLPISKANKLRMGIIKNNKERYLSGYMNMSSSPIKNQEIYNNENIQSNNNLNNKLHQHSSNYNSNIYLNERDFSEDNISLLNMKDSKYTSLRQFNDREVSMNKSDNNNLGNLNKTFQLTKKASEIKIISYNQKMEEDFGKIPKMKPKSPSMIFLQAKDNFKKIVSRRINLGVVDKNLINRRFSVSHVTSKISNKFQII